MRPRHFPSPSPHPRSTIRSLGASVNEAKRSIDSLSAAVAQRRGAAPAGGDGEVLDAEAYGLAGELRAAKASYRSDFDGLKAAREELEPAVQVGAGGRGGGRGGLWAEQRGLRGCAAGGLQGSRG
jgi:hypothetical protein